MTLINRCFRYLPWTSSSHRLRLLFLTASKNSALIRTFIFIIHFLRLTSHLRILVFSGRFLRRIEQLFLQILNNVSLRTTITNTTALLKHIACILFSNTICKLSILSSISYSFCTSLPWIFLVSVRRLVWFICANSLVRASKCFPVFSWIFCTSGVFGAVDFLLRLRWDVRFFGGRFLCVSLPYFSVFIIR